MSSETVLLKHIYIVQKISLFLFVKFNQICILYITISTIWEIYTTTVGLLYAISVVISSPGFQDEYNGYGSCFHYAGMHS